MILRTVHCLFRFSSLQNKISVNMLWTKTYSFFPSCSFINDSWEPTLKWIEHLSYQQHLHQHNHGHHEFAHDHLRTNIVDHLCHRYCTKKITGFFGVDLKNEDQVNFFSYIRDVCHRKIYAFLGEKFKCPPQANIYEWLNFRFLTELVSGTQHLGGETPATGNQKAWRGEGGGVPEVKYLSTWLPEYPSTWILEYEYLSN